MVTAPRSPAATPFQAELVRSLATLGGFDLALIGTVSEAGGRVDSQASVQGHDPQPLSYDIARTPCEWTIKGRAYAIADRATERYPQDAELVELGLEGYAGVAFDDPLTGRTGIVVVATAEPIERPSELVETLRTFAHAVCAARQAEAAAVDQAIVNEVVSTLPKAMVILDSDERVLQVNAMGVALLGVERQGEPLRDQLGPIALASLEPLLRAAHDRRTHECDFWLRARADESHPRLIRARTTPIMDGQACAILARDITDVAGQAARMQLAAEAAGVVPWDWSIEGNSFRTSEHWARLIGASEPREQYDFDQWRERIHPVDRRAVQAAICEGLSSDAGLLDTTYRLCRNDGRSLWVRSFGRVVERDEHGNPLRAIGCTLDVDNEHKAREETRRLQNQLTRFVEFTPAAVAMLDEQLRYILVSDGWCRFTGQTADELVCRRHFEVFPQLAESWSGRFERCLAGTPSESSRDLLVCPSGQPIWVRWCLRPWQRADGSVGGCLLVVDDVTRDVEQEARMAELLDAAESANRTKSEFLANMSHEIRTPLTAVLGFADLLLEGCPAPEDAAEFARTIQRNAGHLLQLVDDILDHSKIEEGKLAIEIQPVDPRQVATDVAELFEARARAKGLSLEVRLGAEVPTRIQTDGTRLKQVLANLVGNAIKFTEQGRVRIELDYDGDQRRLRTVVSDTGIGMTPDQLRRVFERFSQADASTTRRFGGTGLGLSISRELTRLLGGKLTATSELGQGTRFVVDLAPVQVDGTASGPHVDEVPAALPTPSLAGLRVLLADDGRDNRRLISLVLRRAGCTVEAVGDGHSAVDAVRRAAAGPEPFDLVLMDVQMPELDGYEATAALRRAGFELPIVALTAHTMSDERARAQAVGCDGFQSKPIDRVELLRAIDELTLGSPNRVDAASPD
ncbi:MAG: ATP-binding protein [Planctomycetota bacterium]